MLFIIEVRVGVMSAIGRDRSVAIRGALVDRVEWGARADATRGTVV